jgi:hypothetical protein
MKSILSISLFIFTATTQAATVTQKDGITILEEGSVIYCESNTWFEYAQAALNKNLTATSITVQTQFQTIRVDEPFKSVSVPVIDRNNNNGLVTICVTITK